MGFCGRFFVGDRSPTAGERGGSFIGVCLGHCTDAGTIPVMGMGCVGLGASSRQVSGMEYTRGSASASATFGVEYSCTWAGASRGLAATASAAAHNAG